MSPEPSGSGCAASRGCRSPAAWQALLEAMPDAVWLVDPRTLGIVAANRAAAVLSRSAAPDPLGRPVGELFASPEDACFWDEVAAGTSEAIDSDTLMLCAGVAVPVARRVGKFVVGAPAETFYLVSVRDRSDEVRAQRARDRAVAELSATLESTPDGILVTDLAGRIRNFNRRFAAVWDLPAELTARRDDDAVLDWMRRAVIDPPAYMRRLAVIDGAVLAESTDIVLLRSGKVVERITRPQCANGEPIGRIASFRDITTTLDAQQSVQTLSCTDALTGLPNQRLLNDRLAQSLAMARRDGTRFGLLVVRLDRFADVHETLGRIGADRVLQEIAERVAACMRRVDTVARVDVDRFVVLAHQADAGGAEMAAVRLIDALTPPIRHGATTRVDVGASIGIALCPKDGDAADDLLHNAEAAMHAARQAGGGFRFHAPAQPPSKEGAATDRSRS